MFGGTPLESYCVYLDNGDIEEWSKAFDNKIKTAGQRLQSSTGFNTRQPEKRPSDIGNKHPYIIAKSAGKINRLSFYTLFRCLGKGAIYGIRQSEKHLKIWTKKKAALYVRVSTRYQVDKDSLPFQRKKLKEYCKFLGLEDHVIFEDDGYSAKNTERPHFQEMMSRVRSGEFSHLIVGRWIVFPEIFWTSRQCTRN